MMRQAHPAIAGAKKTDLEQIKLQVEAFDKQKVVLQQGEYDRAVAAGPHRGAGTSGPGCQHSFASREPVVDVDVEERSTITMDGAAVR